MIVQIIYGGKNDESKNYINKCTYFLLNIIHKQFRLLKTNLGGMDLWKENKKK